MLFTLASESESASSITPHASEHYFMKATLMAQVHCMPVKTNVKPD
jgi:hypothetical protein